MIEASHIFFCGKSKCLLKLIFSYGCLIKKAFFRKCAVISQNGKRYDFFLCIFTKNLHFLLGFFFHGEIYFKKSFPDRLGRNPAGPLPRASFLPPPPCVARTPRRSPSRTPPRAGPSSKPLPPAPLYCFFTSLSWCSLMIF